MIKPSSPVNLGFVFALGSAMLFAIRPIFVKLVYAEDVDPVTLLAFRMLFSAPIYLALLIYFLRLPEMRARLNGPTILKVAAVGMLGYYSASILDLFGLEYLTAQLARMILYIYPTIVVLLGALFFGGQITGRIVISLITTYVGIAVIFGHDLSVFGTEVIIGTLFIIASAISFAFYLLFGKPLIDRIGSRLFTCVALISASFGILIHFFASHSISETHVSNRGLLLILVIAIFCTVIPTFLTTAAVSRIGADKTGIIATTGPAFTSLTAVLILGESFTSYHLAGISLTVLGVAILQKG